MGPIPLGINIAAGSTFLINNGTGPWSTVVPMIVADGYKAIRMQFTWGGIQSNALDEGLPITSAHSYNLIVGNRYQPILDAAFAAGLKVTINIWSTPDWACLSGLTVGSTCPPDPAKYAVYCGLVAQWFHDRYGSGFLQAIEIWNESNIRPFWSADGSVSVAPQSYYYPLIAGAAAAIRAVDPTIKIIGAVYSTSDDPNLTTMLTDPTYGPGILAACDAFSCHPYQTPSDGAHDPYTTPGSPARNYFQNLPNFIEVAASYGKPTWVTEFNWSNSAGLCTEQQQHDYTLIALQLMATWGVERAFVFTSWNWPTAPPANKTNGYSVYNYDLSRSLLATALAAYNDDNAYTVDFTERWRNVDISETWARRDVIETPWNLEVTG